jgi:anti-repressor protein
MNIIPFNFQSNEVRVIEKEGEPWFVAKDIAELLGYSNTAKAVRDHCKGVNEMDTPTQGGVQTVKVIPERDLYRLIMRSKMPEAEKFEEWVVGEVLPSIRKTGSYGVQAIDFSNQHQVAGLLAQSLERVQEQQNKIEQDKPKVEFHDKVIVSEDSISIGDAAKVLGTGRNRLLSFLRKKAWVTRKNEPYQAKIEGGYMDVKLSPWEHPTQGLQRSVTPLVTGKGLVQLQNLYGVI